MLSDWHLFPNELKIKARKKRPTTLASKSDTVHVACKMMLPFLVSSFNSPDILTTSPHYLYKKCIETRKENVTLTLGIKG